MAVNLGSELERLAHSQGGVFTKAQAAAVGMTSHTLRSLIREGLCTRPIRGGYALARDAPPSARHLDRLRLALLLDAQAAAEASSLQHLAGKYYRHQGQYQRIVAVRVQNHAAEAICQRVLTNETTSLYDTHSTLARFIEPATWAEVSQQEFQQALDARIQQLLAGMEAA